MNERVLNTEAQNVHVCLFTWIFPFDPTCWGNMASKPSLRFLLCLLQISHMDQTLTLIMESLTFLLDQRESGGGESRGRSRPRLKRTGNVLPNQESLPTYEQLSSSPSPLSNTTGPAMDPPCCLTASQDESCWDLNTSTFSCICLISWNVSIYPPSLIPSCQSFAECRVRWSEHLGQQGYEQQNMLWNLFSLWVFIVYWVLYSKIFQENAKHTALCCCFSMQKFWQLRCKTLSWGHSRFPQAECWTWL